MVECQLPKLDAGGSSPLSRSMFSITSENLVVARYRVFEVMRRSTGFNLLIRRGFEGLTSSLTGWHSRWYTAIRQGSDARERFLALSRNKDEKAKLLGTDVDRRHRVNIDSLPCIREHYLRGLLPLSVDVNRPTIVLASVCG